MAIAIYNPETGTYKSCSGDTFKSCDIGTYPTNLWILSTLVDFHAGNITIGEAYRNIQNNIDYFYTNQ